MTQKDTLMAALDKVGATISAAEKAGKKLSGEESKECRAVLKDTTKRLFALRLRSGRESAGIRRKLQALEKSVKESLIETRDAEKERGRISRASVSQKITARRILRALADVKDLAQKVNTMSEVKADGGEEFDEKSPEYLAKSFVNGNISHVREIIGNDIKLFVAVQNLLKEQGQDTESFSRTMTAASKSEVKAETIPAAPEKAAAPAQSAPAPVPTASPATETASTEKQAASPENEKLDKGVATDAQVKTPESAPAPKSPEDTPPAPTTTKNEKGENANPLDQQSAAEKTPVVSMSSRESRAKRMYTQAMSLCKKAEAEKDAERKTVIEKRMAMLERMADALVRAEALEIKKQAEAEKDVKKKATLSRRVAALTAMLGEEPKAAEKKTASVQKKAEDIKEAASTVFATNDSVLLPDGVVGKVSSVDGEKLVVNVAGVNKEVVADAVKKITSMKKEKKADVAKPVEAKTESTQPKEKTMSMAERVRKGIAIVRGGKKKTAQEVDDVVPAVAPGAPESTKEEVTESAGAAPVSAVDTKAISYTDGVGWTVTVSENEVLSFGEDKGAAEAFIKTEAGKKQAAQVDDIIDSADHAKPEGSADVQKELKGLDQKGKDGAASTSDQKVDPQFSMVSSKAKTGTAATKDSPVDSASTKAPDSTEGVAKKLKGLDQSGKDGGATKADQKVDPQLSVFAARERILKETVKKTYSRLAVVEAQLLADRLVKVGCITEEQRADQEKVLAELYANSLPDFAAYKRLVENLETKPGKTMASRTAAKVQASMDRRNPVVLETISGSVTGSLEHGTFFEDEEK